MDEVAQCEVKDVEFCVVVDKNARSRKIAPRAVYGTERHIDSPVSRASQMGVHKPTLSKTLGIRS